MRRENGGHITDNSTVYPELFGGIWCRVTWRTCPALNEAV